MVHFIYHTLQCLCLDLMSIQACPTARSIRNATSLLFVPYCLSEPIEQSVWRHAMVWTVRASNPVGARFSAPVMVPFLQ